MPKLCAVKHKLAALGVVAKHAQPTPTQSGYAAPNTDGQHHTHAPHPLAHKANVVAAAAEVVVDDAIVEIDDPSAD